MTTDELRQRYLDFFQQKTHKVFSSDSLVPPNDPSVLFTGAGMNQFKPYFLGLKKDVKRATSCQKCLRTADLDRVGKTAYHHSFFEMLGNFSFGDYFKEEAIAWGWEFVTKVLKLSPDNLWVSVYQEDDEAYAVWKNKIGLPDSRIVRMGPEDNFWPANAPKNGPNGLCGPCSEIYIGRTPGKGVEIWNLVFTQYDRQPDGSLKPLPQKNIDTGMGLERTASVLQGVESNFDIDIFRAFRADLKKLLKKGSAETARENAVMDHARAVVFSIADGVLPSNEGRGYVTRKLVRLASDHLMKAGAERRGLFAETVPSVIRIMKSAYPELVRQESSIVQIVANEERAYEEALAATPKMEEEQKVARASLTGEALLTKAAEIAFKYYDSYGLPFETVSASAAAISRVDPKLLDPKIHELLDQQRDRSRKASKIAGEIFSKGFHELVSGLKPTEFVGYERHEQKGAKLLRIIKGQGVADEIREGEEGLLIFDKTPFYAEAGGQIGDAGRIRGAGFEAEVTDTQWLEKCAGHKVLVKKGRAKTGDALDLAIEGQRRDDIMKNHTATHLAHSALRKVLGEHVKQSGSLVSRDYLRFDFTHPTAVGPEKLALVEDLVNAEIAKNIKLNKKVISKDKAVKEGAIAFFGEKYGERVRVVSIGDFSKELCGGTHLESTGQIGLFRIVSEGSIQAGVRRIEAVTGRAAQELAKAEKGELEALVGEFHAGTTARLAETMEKGKRRMESAKSRIQNLVDSRMRDKAKEILQRSREVQGVRIVMLSAPYADVDLIRKNFEFLKTQSTPFAAVYEAVADDKFTYVVAGADALVQRGFNAGNIVREIAKEVKGSGGGRPDFAVGGSKELELCSKVLPLGGRILEASVSSLGASK